MAQTTWKQVVLDTADAIREANGTSDKIPVGQIADKVRSGAGIPYEGDNPLTLGSAGYTFPAKTLLKDGLQIINGVNGEDLTDTAADQTTAVTELMKMVSRKIAMNNGEGQYVWAKRTGKRIYLKQITDRVNPTILQVSSDTTDLSKIDTSWFVGVYGTCTVNGGTYSWEFLSETQARIDNEYVTYTYDASTARLSIAINLSLGNRVWSVYEENVTESFLVSDDTNAYPDGEELDGYWYERYTTEAEEGVPVIDYGTFTVSTYRTDVTVAHKLGLVPSKVYILGNRVNVWDSNSYATVVLASNVPIISDSTTVYGLTSWTGGSGFDTIENASWVTATANNITALRVGSQAGSASYTWIAIA